MKLITKESILEHGITITIGNLPNVGKQRIIKYLKQITGNSYGIGDNHQIVDYVIVKDGSLYSGRGNCIKENQLVNGIDFMAIMRFRLKGQLEDGMRVITRNGNKLWKCGSCFTNGHITFDIASYDNNLLMPNAPHLDIVKIFAANDYSGNTIYERKEVLKVSLDEIAEWKGVSKEQIEIED